MKKFLQFIVIFRNIIVLVWLILILILFKIINNFNFKNGQSIIFALLLAVIPSFVYILSHINKKKIKVARTNRKMSFFEKIKDDYKTKKFQKHLLDKLEGLGLSFDLVDESAITLKNQFLNICFDLNEASISINDTLVNYRFFYLESDELNKYDTTYMAKRDTLALYIAIVNKIKQLINVKMIYQNDWKRIILYRMDSEAVLYEYIYSKIKQKQLKIQKVKKESKIIEIYPQKFIK